MRTWSCSTLLALGLLAGCQDATLAPIATSGEPVSAAPGGSGFYVTPEGAIVPVDFEAKREGHVIWGDILVDPGEIFSTREAAEESVQMRGESAGDMIAASSARRWPDGVVPYAYASGYPYVADVESAIAHIEQVTGVDFVRRTTQSDYVYIIAGDGCYSALGRAGGRQTLSVGVSCPDPRRGVAIHEFGHALGIYHEHQRCDRDSYIRVNWENIDSSRRSSFDKICSSYTRILYDYNEGSIMHYPAWRGSSNGEPTMTSLRGRTLGQLLEFNALDRQSIAYMYPDDGGGGGCSITGTTYNGSLAGTNSYQIHPNGSYYYSSTSGTHRGCLTGPSETNFDLYLQRWSGSAWGTVASSTTTGSSETLGFSGSSGYYRWIVISRGGSGSYSVVIARP